MGWWDQTIYGGDEALNWKERIYDICDTEEYTKSIKNSTQIISSDKLSSKLDEIVLAIDSAEGADYRNIGYQVLATIAMASGISIEKSLKKRIIEAAEDDDYAGKHKIRKNVMDNLKKTVEEYDQSNPINLEEYNMLVEPEESQDERAKEFREMFFLIDSRMKKLRSQKNEKSGVIEYDDGFSDACDEELAFLEDFKELMEKQQLLGELLDKIATGAFDNQEDENSESYPVEQGDYVNESYADSQVYESEPDSAPLSYEAPLSSGEISYSSEGKGMNSGGGDVMPG